MVMLAKNLTIRGQMMYSRKQAAKCIRMIENGNLSLGKSVGLTVAGTFELDEIERPLIARVGREAGGMKSF